MQPAQWHVNYNCGKAIRRLGAAGGVASACTRPLNGHPLPSKALKVLGVTFDEVRMEKAARVLGEAPWTSNGGASDPDQGCFGWSTLGAAFSPRQRVASPLPVVPGAGAGNGAGAEHEGKLHALFGTAAPLPKERWTQRAQPQPQRTYHTKALSVLGTTFDDLSTQKALLVMGEAPGARAVTS